MAMKDIKPAQREINIDKAMTLRLQNLSYSEIAAEIGVSKATAFLYVKIAAKQAQKKYTEKADLIIVMELNKLDKLEKALREDAHAGDVRAASTILKIMERRSRLLGLDSPSRTEVKTNTIDVKIDLPQEIEIA